MGQTSSNRNENVTNIEVHNKKNVQIRNLAGLSSPDSVIGRFTDVSKSINDGEQADITLEILSFNSSEKDKIELKEGDEITVTLKHEKGQINYYYEKDGNYANGEIYPYQMKAILESLDETERAKLKKYLNIDEIDPYALFCKEAVRATREFRKQADRANIALAA